MNVKMIRSILREYGLSWAVNRSLYSIKLKMINALPVTEFFFERRISYPKRLDIFQIDVDFLKQFIKNLSENDRKALIKHADDAVKGKILGFSSIELDYGYPINWQLNPLTKKECDVKKKWYQISDFDPERGDIKVIWEISRMSHFVTLSRAYLLTDDERYYRAFSEQLEDWLKKNPYSYGANFKCGQECSLRMVNALLAYTVFKNCGVATKADKNNIQQLIHRCYRKIRSNFFYAYKCIKNNHTISELVGMLLGSWCCADEASLNCAFKLLDKTIDEQFMEDGGYTQYSFNYQRLALQDIEILLAVEKKAGNFLSAVSRKKILNAVKLMYQCQDKCGDMPNYGANDGALVFPVTSCVYRDFRPVINTVHALLTGHRVYEDGRYDEELIWFGGTSAKCFQLKQMERVSSSFQQAGLYTIRNRNSWLMIVLNNYKTRPAHMDQMHVDLWVREMNVLCDGGTFSYASDLGKKLVRNDSHNTVVCNNKSQMNAYGHFMIYDWTKCVNVEADEKSFHGEMMSRNGYVHKRSIEQTNTGYIIEDIIKGKNNQKYDVLFHTPCEVQEESNGINLIHEGDRICSMQFNTAFRVYKSSRSLHYLKTDATYCIAVSGVIKNRNSCIKTKITIGKGI